MLRARGEPPQRGLRAVIVEAHPVDHGLVTLEAEQPRPRIAACGFGVTEPISTKPKPSRSSASGTSGALVEARGHADRIGKVEPEGAHRELGIVERAA